MGRWKSLCWLFRGCARAKKSSHCFTMVRYGCGEIYRLVFHAYRSQGKALKRLTCCFIGLYCSIVRVVMSNFYDSIDLESIVGLLSIITRAMELLECAKNDCHLHVGGLTDSFIHYYEVTAEKELLVDRDFFLKDRHDLQDYRLCDGILFLYEEKMRKISKMTGDPVEEIRYRIEFFRRISLILIKLIELKVKNDKLEFNKHFEAARQDIDCIWSISLHDGIRMDANFEKYYDDEFFPMYEDIGDELYRLYVMLSDNDKLFKEKICEMQKYF